MLVSYKMSLGIFDWITPNDPLVISTGAWDSHYLTYNNYNHTWREYRGRQTRPMTYTHLASDLYIDSIAQKSCILDVLDSIQAQNRLTIFSYQPGVEQLFRRPHWHKPIPGKIFRAPVTYAGLMLTVDIHVDIVCISTQIILLSVDEWIRRLWFRAVHKAILCLSIVNIMCINCEQFHTLSSD